MVEEPQELNHNVDMSTMCISKRIKGSNHLSPKCKDVIDGVEGWRLLDGVYRKGYDLQI